MNGCVVKDFPSGRFDNVNPEKITASTDDNFQYNATDKALLSDHAWIIEISNSLDSVTPGRHVYSINTFPSVGTDEGVTGEFLRAVLKATHFRDQGDVRCLGLPPWRRRVP